MLNPDLQPLANLGRLEVLAHYLRHRRREKRLYSPASVYVDPVTSALDLRSARPQTDRASGRGFRLCCLAHVYYPDLWPVLARHIGNIPPNLFDLYVNLVDSTWTEESETLVRRGFPEARIYVSPNRGRDIGGFFALLRNIDLDDYDAVCLVHTKKSPHMSGSEAEKWRDDLLGAILGSSDVARQNIDLLRENGKVGLIGSAQWRNTQISGNADFYDRLLDGFRIEGDHRRCEYLSGTMMFLRASVLKELYEALRFTQFEDGDERSLTFHQDGQIAHAVERLIGNIVRKQGYEFAWR
jgi:lipopolysaccharide biosynthesis protein